MELIQYLDRLKLTLYEKEVILYLSSVDFADAKTIYKEAKIPQGRIYSVLDELQKKGFVIAIPGKPKRYQIKAVKESLKFYLQKRKAELDEKIEKINSIELKPKSYHISENKPSINMYKGKDEHFNAIIKIRDSAKKEILQTASTFKGTFATNLSLKKALQKGVKIKIIILNITEKSKKNIRTCLEHGGEIRKNNTIKGLSIMIKDSIELLLGVAYYKKDPERIMISSQNPALINTLKQTFENLWKESTPITLKDLE